MRIECLKYLFVGPKSRLDSFFERAQALGCIEFIEKSKGMEESSEEVQVFIDALHILRKRVPVHQVRGGVEDYRSGVVIARDIVEKNGEIEKLHEEKRILEKEIARVAVFGDFSVQDLQQVEQETKRVVQFFFAKKNAVTDAPQRPEVFYVGSRYGLDYYTAINKEKVSYQGFVEMHVDRSLSDLQAELAGVRRRIDTFEADLEFLSHQKKLLQMGLINALNHTHLVGSKEKTSDVLEGDVFTVFGWVPKNKISLVEKLANEQGVLFSPVAEETGDKKPTYLENKGPAKLGEDLIGIYDIPSPFDRDPSLWVFFAFGLFFSMIIGDAGYGLILLAISLWLFFKYGKKGGLAKRVIQLSMFLSIGCILWGILTASFLGLSFDPDSKWRKLSLIDWMVNKKAEYLIKTQDTNYQELIKHHPELEGIKDPKAFVMGVQKKDEKGGVKYTIHEEFADNVMMEIVIFIGTIHIMLSLLRYLDRNWAALGWIVFMIGAYLKFPTILHATSLIHYLFHVPMESGAKLGLYLIYSGIALATILALIQRKWAGLEEPTRVIGVFADVMSYLRIYALALAGVIMGGTFNKMGASVPFYLGIFIIFFGHTVNFTLALMGGLIHGLRLNFIEWYHYSFEGGGKRFNPLALLKFE